MKAVISVVAIGVSIAAAATAKADPVAPEPVEVDAASQVPSTAPALNAQADDIVKFVCAYRVSAGPVDRIMTPVYCDMPLESAWGEEPAHVRSDEGIHSAQLEVLDEKRLRVWWMIYRLDAGKKRTYEITIGEPVGLKARRFHWNAVTGPEAQSMVLRHGGQPVLEYMHTPFDPKNIELTKKVFHHVYGPDDERRLTKGPGGLYPHHRGIFFGYNKCMIDGERSDIWHAANGERQLHRRVVRTIEGPVLGGHVLEIDWNDRQGKTFAKELRRVVAWGQPEGTCLIEFSTELRATGATVALQGDRQHAGVQFRAAQQVADNKQATRYLRPERWAHLDPAREVNGSDYMELPWNAIQFSLDGHPYTVAYLSDPSNPADAGFSERLYGRFGEYCPYELKKDRPLRLCYRWYITASHDVTREQIERAYRDLAHPPHVEMMPVTGIRRLR